MTTSDDDKIAGIDKPAVLKNSTNTFRSMAGKFRAKRLKTKLMFTSAIVLAITIHFHIYAQSEPAGQLTQPATLKHVDTYSGLLTDWILSIQKYVYVGFYLQTSGEKFMVMFPANMTDKLRKAVKVGNTITVNAIEINDTLGIRRLNLVNVIVDGETLQGNPPVVTDSLAAAEIIDGNAKIRELQKNVEGKITGYILDNKTILRIAPNINTGLDKLLIVGAGISYSGTKSYSGSGEDAWASYTIIRCQRITINGKEYLTQYVYP